MRIHHVGVVTSNMDRSITIYEKLGYRKAVDVIDPFQNNRIVMMDRREGVMIELIWPANEQSTVRNFSDGYHHLCYEMEPGEDVGQGFKRLRIGKIFTEPITAPAFDGRKVVFACLLDGSFIEFILCEEGEKKNEVRNDGRSH